MYLLEEILAELQERHCFNEENILCLCFRENARLVTEREDLAGQH